MSKSVVYQVLTSMVPNDRSQKKQVVRHLRGGLLGRAESGHCLGLHNKTAESEYAFSRFGRLVLSVGSSAKAKPDADFKARFVLRLATAPNQRGGQGQAEN